MQTAKWGVPLLVWAALVVGCASMSESECKTADWYRKGLADGSAGAPEGRLGAHHEACAKAGVVPHAASWRRGWDEGIRRYCVPAVGWREGVAGSGYAGVCRGSEQEDGFLQAYNTGRELHRTENRMTSNRLEVERVEAQLAKSQSAEERRNLRERLRLLDVEQSQLRHAASQLRLSAP